MTIHKRKPWQDRIQRIIFETDTVAGKNFDIALLIAIACSFVVILLSSVEPIFKQYRYLLVGLEWFFTILFTLEYLARLASVEKKLRYITSFFGVIDLLSIIPTYLSLFIVGSESLAILRTFRLLRVFRVLELPQYTSGARKILLALQASRPKITVFLTFVMTVVVAVGAVMYNVEGKGSGFTSIPRSIYWAIVTITTVGYGDIAPQTVLGQSIASVIMILGYAIIAVPTGIVTSEIQTQSRIDEEAGDSEEVGTPEPFKYCPHCGKPLER